MTVATAPALSPRAGRWLAVSLGGLLALILIFALASPHLPPQERVGEHAASRSAPGYAGLAALLKETGWTVRLNQRTFGWTKPEADLEVLSLEDLAAPGAVSLQGDRIVGQGKMSYMVEHLQRPLGRNVLGLMDKWSYNSSPDDPRLAINGVLAPLERIVPGLYQFTTLKRPTNAPAPVQAAMAPTVNSASAFSLTRAQGAEPVILTPAPGQSLYTRPIRVGVVNGLQSLRGPDFKPILLGPEGQAVLVQVIGTRRFLLADPDLVNNRAMAKVSTAFAAAQILAPLGGAEKSVVFDLTLSNYVQDRNLLLLITDPPLLGTLLCALIALGAGIWRAAFRFGPPVRPPATALGRGVNLLADNAAVLVETTRREAAMARLYIDFVRSRALKGQPQPEPGEPEPADALGALRGTSEAFSAIAAAAVAAKTPAAAVQAAKRAHIWKTEITGEHR